VTVKRLEVRKETYRDSITMLKISNEVAKLEGVSQAALVMATPLNKKILRDIGFVSSEIDNAKSDDMIIAVEATTSEALENAYAKAEELLVMKAPSSAESQTLPKTLAAAVAQMQDANMVLISVPGQFAKREAVTAINHGLNVFLFSSNVSVEDELELKQKAISKHLLMMGPDCGTSIINGTVLGFGNVLRRGPVGIVSASGTGLQQVSTLLDRQGIGISQGIGTGGNDLSDSVGGLMMLEGIRLLNEDSETKVIVLVSKPPGEITEEKVLQVASRCSKPVVVNFLTKKKVELSGNNCEGARTLEEAADLAAKRLGAAAVADTSTERGNLDGAARVEWERLAAGQKYVRGLYSGGTLCYEAQLVMSPLLGEIRSNAPLDKAMLLGGESKKSDCHTCVDMGAEEFVVGRAHPMIDYTLRKLRILVDARNPETAVILLDVILGYGSNIDPAAQLVPVITEAKKAAEAGGRYLSTVACVVGTKQDPQRIEEQENRLKEAGVVLLPSNARAARLAAR
jgi:FdrA protein